MDLPEKISSKLHTLAEATEFIKAFQQSGKKVVFTNGCFDLLHAGHVIYLQEARDQGDLLVLGLNSDDSVRRLKGENRPVRAEIDRAVLLAGLESVDLVAVFEEDTPEKLIKKLRPDVLVKGGDYALSEIVGADFVQSIGGQVVIIPFVEGFSSSNIIDKIIQTHQK